MCVHDCWIFIAETPVSQRFPWPVQSYPVHEDQGMMDKRPFFMQSNRLAKPRRQKTIVKDGLEREESFRGR